MNSYERVYHLSELYSFSEHSLSAEESKCGQEIPFYAVGEKKRMEIAAVDASFSPPVVLERNSPLVKSPIIPGKAFSPKTSPSPGLTFEKGNAKSRIGHSSIPPSSSMESLLAKPIPKKILSGENKQSK